jgi:hypothetical protein
MAENSPSYCLDQCFYRRKKIWNNSATALDARNYILQGQRLAKEILQIERKNCLELGLSREELIQREEEEESA